jgi:alpha-L-fucosidase
VIPPESVERLTAVGRWMDVNGEAIHGTDAGPFPRRLAWGRVTSRRGTDGGTTLYLHVWDWPDHGNILLPTLKELPVSAKLLGGNAAVTAESTPEGIVVHLPGQATDPDVSVVRLDFAGPVTVTQTPFIEPAADGTVTFGPTDADLHGGYTGNIQVRGSGADAYLTDWKNPEWRAEYQLKTAKAGKWRVEADVAVPEPVKLVLKVGKTSTPVALEATGTGLTWKTVNLGAIELPSGETGFTLTGAPDDWKGVSLRRVKLVPAP